MKRQLTGIIVGTMFAITGAVLPASATEPNTNSQQRIDAENSRRRIDAENYYDPLLERRRHKPPSKRDRFKPTSVTNFLRDHTNIPTSKSEWADFGNASVQAGKTMFSQVKFDYFYYMLAVTMASLTRRRNDDGK